MSYDPQTRRDTPLARKLKELIRERGPMPLARYMAACLNDREHGYYMRNEAIGRGGDFITAPEISQIFGELIGLWCVVTWQAMGEPDPIHVVEIGPGRGTMMRDMVRAVSRVPRFPAAVRFRLSEPSPRLRAIQAETLAGAAIPISHMEPHEPPDGPTIMVANEVLDCIPIDQLVRASGPDGKTGWFARTVEIGSSGGLQFGVGRAVPTPVELDVAGAQLGDVLEGGRTRLKFETLGRDFAGRPLAALFLDYGYNEPATGDTLQAVRGHAFEHPLTSPGEADLTAHVNFAQVGHAATTAGFAVDGPITQAEFLGRLGIVERASRLMSANPAQAAEIEQAVVRLMAPNGMGTRFKAIGIRSPHLPKLPGFA